MARPTNAARLARWQDTQRELARAHRAGGRARARGCLCPTAIVFSGDGRTCFRHCPSCGYRAVAIFGGTIHTVIRSSGRRTA